MSRREMIIVGVAFVAGVVLADRVKALMPSSAPRPAPAA